LTGHRTVITVAALAAVLVVGLVVALLPGSRQSPTASGATAASSSSAAFGSPVPSSVAPGPTSSASTRAPALAVPELAIVPIVGYWSTARSITTAELRLALAGRDPKFKRVIAAEPDLAAIAAALGVQPAPTVKQLSPSSVIAAVLGTTSVLGLIQPEDVRPSIRALGIDGRSLFGDARVRTIADWALTIPAPAAGPAFDPATTWTVVAAGDVMNDREVYRQAVILRQGPDFPWNGGTARIVRRSCCSAGETVVQAAATGHAGAVAALFRDADLALVNHEGPTPNDFSYHPTGLRFSFDPALEAGIHDAGVDVVSLANNHIRNAGSLGVTQTIANEKAAGLVPIGAGRNINAANAPAWFTIDGVRVAILAFDAIDLGGNAATSARPGAAPLDLTRARADIKAARSAGAQVVIVIPHWGVEYTSTATASQRQDATALIADGADVILGSHPHWAGALEAIGKGVVVYSMGDFIFDLDRSEQTDEGLIVELTFVGTHLAQIDIHPTIELQRSQPNLLDLTDGQVILERIRTASRDFLHW
jgi:poly-gamma-glutamate capsule biosynthesis protein CapA/YwtB (metallophosphatase superfamily)